MQEAEKAKQQGIAHSLDISPRQDGIIKLLYYKQLVSHKYEHCWNKCFAAKQEFWV